MAVAASVSPCPLPHLVSVSSTHPSLVSEDVEEGSRTRAGVGEYQGRHPMQTTQLHRDEEWQPNVSGTGNQPEATGLKNVRFLIAFFFVYLSIVTMDRKAREVRVRNPAAAAELPRTFTMDHVFDESLGQPVVYEETCRPIVTNIISGYNGPRSETAVA